MKRLMLVGAFVAAAAFAVAGASAGKDGAQISNSRSTNTLGYTIKVWSDGRGEYTTQQGTGKAFTISASDAQRFFSDVKAARGNSGTPSHCMKSASFGTTTTVRWHGWLSPDLQCPPFSPPVQALAADVRAIQSAANVDSGLHRIPFPHESRMIPTTAPEVSPT